MGRVDFARMHPVTFREYLSATGREFEIEILRNFAFWQSNSIDDFSKYQRRISTDLLRKIFDTIPTLLGQVRVKFSALAPNERTESAKRGLDALISAGLVRKVTHTPARGIPLSTGSDANVFKLVPLDVGLSSTRELGTIRTLSLPSSLFVKWESGNTIERQS